MVLTTTNANCGTDLTLEVSGGSTNGDVTYEIVDNYLIYTGDAMISGDVFTPTGAGTIGVKAIMAGNDTYNEVSVTEIVTIAKGEVTIPTADITEFIYNGSAKTYTLVGYDNGFMTVSGNTQTNAGTYTVIAKLSDPTNYNWSDGTTYDQEFNFVINKASISIASATVESKTFNNTAAATINSVTFTDMQNNEVFENDTDYTVSNAVFEDVNVGTDKTVTATVTLNATDKANNYSLESETLTTNSGEIRKAEALADISGSTTVLSSKYDDKTATDYTYDLSNLTGKADNMGTISYTYSSSTGSMISDTQTTVDGTTLSFTVIPKAADEYATIDVTVTSANYKDSTATITIESVDKSDAGVTVSQDGTTYGTTLAAPVVAAENVTDATGTWTYTYAERGDTTYTSSADKPTAAGTYTVTAVYEDDDYYGSASADFTIAKAAVTVLDNSSDTTATYGENVSLSVKITVDTTSENASEGSVTFKVGNTTLGTANVENGVASITYDTTGGALAINNNTVNVYYTGGDNLADNSTFTLALNLSAKPLDSDDVALTGETFYTYTSAAITTLTIFVTGLTEDTDYEVAYSDNVNVGTATVTVTGIGNYTGTVTKEFTITNADVTVTPTAASKTYDETDPAFAYTTSLVADSDLEKAFNDAVTGELAREAGEDVDSYEITLGTLGAGNNFNVTLSDTTVNFTIEQKDVTAPNEATTANVVKGSGAFTEPTFGDVTGNIEYGYNNTTGTYGNVVAYLATLAKDATGSITYTYTANGNYTGAITGTITYTIIDIVFTGEMTVTNSDYGTTWANVIDFANHDYAATLDGESISGTYTLKIGDAAYDSTAIPTVGTYTYTVTFTNADYSAGVQVATGNVTISQLAATLAWNVDGLVYDGTSILTPTATVSNKVGEDEVNVTVTGGEINAGTYTATATGLTGADADNYSFTSEDKEFTIAKADSDLSDNTGTTTATATYGETITLSVEIAVRSISDITASANTVAFYVGDTCLDTATVTNGVATITYDTTDRDLKIGENTINAYYGGSDNLNTGSLIDTLKVTLSPKALTAAMVSDITAVDYTGSAIEPTVVVADGTTLELGTDYSVAYSNNTNAGTATVEITGMDYYTTTVSKDFTINKVDFNETKTAETAAKYGTTGTLSLSDWADLTGAAFGTIAVTDADGILVANSYQVVDGKLSYELEDAIAKVGKTATITIPVTSTNYNDFNIEVTVTVSEKDFPVLEISEMTKTYDGVTITAADIIGTATVGETEIEGAWSFENGETMTNVADTNTYTVVFTPNDADNYGIVEMDVVVTINTATITITADSQTAYNGYDEPTYTYTVTGLVGEETLETEPSEVAGVDVDMSTNGTYVIEVTEDATASENYTIEYVDGTLTVKTKSSSSGGSSSSSSTTTTDTAETTTSDDGSVTATVESSSSTSNGTTTVTVDDADVETAIETAIDEADGEDAYVEISVTTKSSTETIEVALSTDALSTIADSDVESLVITSDLATIAISTDALAEIIDQVAGDDVAISVAFTDTTDILSDVLSTEYQTVIGDSVVVDMTIISGDDAITSIGGEKITVAVPYELNDGEEAENMVVWAIDADGYITVLPTEYDEEIGTLEFSATEVVTFVIVNDTNEFTDIEPNNYYYGPVLWAVESGITNGIDDESFDATTACTRDQIVTFLYRAAGEPEVSGDMTFADVDTDAYYANAVIWAVENGITNGYGDATFAPNEECSRDQIVTFLFRAAGEPEVASAVEFADVDADTYYANAVAWAVENGITNGTSTTTFDPNQDCTRGQIVTFLYRSMAE